MSPRAALWASLPALLFASSIRTAHADEPEPGGGSVIRVVAVRDLEPARPPASPAAVAPVAASVPVAPSVELPRREIGSLAATTARAYALQPVDDGAFSFAPPVSAPPAVDRAAESDESRRRGVLGPVRLGLLAGAGFPSAVSGQAQISLYDWVGVAASYGGSPAVSLPIGPADVSLAQRSYSASLRLFPFRGAFFVGAGAGVNTLTGQSRASAQGQVAEASMQTTTHFIAPEIGLLYRFPFGLAIGADVGVQMPFRAVRDQSASLNGQSASVPEDLRTAMRSLENTPIPVVNLLRLGYVL